MAEVSPNYALQTTPDELSRLNENVGRREESVQMREDMIELIRSYLEKEFPDRTIELVTASGVTKVER